MRGRPRITGGPGTAYGTGVHVGDLMLRTREITSIVTPRFTPERCLAAGVFDPCEIGTTVPLQVIAPLVLRMSGVTGYPFLATATTRRKSAPLDPVCLRSVPRNHCTVPVAILPMSSCSFSWNNQSLRARRGLSCDLQDCELTSALSSDEPFDERPEWRFYRRESRSDI